MTYQEKEISKNQLEKFIQVLDLDEGIRIENKLNMIFLNKSAKRYCVNIDTDGKNVFVYYNSPAEVLDFFKNTVDDICKIYSY